MIKFDKEFFNIEDTLFSGQLFRFKAHDCGYILQAENKACYLFYDGEYTCVESAFDDYFYNYFDLARDYNAIYIKAKDYNFPYLTEAAESSKGVRILNQNREEALLSFIISQNNNIPRIKKSVNSICSAFGERFEFHGETLYSFPTSKKLSTVMTEDYKQMGLGYRSEYIPMVSKLITEGFLKDADSLNTQELRNKLITLKGVGEKVADCALLFGFSRRDVFPVDTWIEKLYHDNFNGALTDRKKISRFFVDIFCDYSGYFQQYLFYYKRGK